MSVDGPFPHDGNADLLLFSTVSTGIRFTTLPDATPPSFQPPAETSEISVLPSASPSCHVSQPATTITALFNPMIGHISGAYTARVSKDLSLSSRFDFNVYSYESEWTMGAEWWLRPSRSNPVSDGISDGPPTVSSPSLSESFTLPSDVTGVVKARASTSNVSPQSPPACRSCSTFVSTHRTLRCSGRVA